MNKGLMKFIASFVVGYFALLAISPQLANFSLSVFLVLLIPLLIARHFFMDAVYKNSIGIVPKKFVFNQYTVTNEHCTIKYTPDEKIVVIENIAGKKREQRTFTISKANGVNVNKCWNQVCKIFDSFVCMDSLVSFFSYDTKVDVKLIPVRSHEKETDTQTVRIDTSKQGPKFVDMDTVRPDIYAEGTDRARQFAENFVNIENIKEADKVNEREIKAPDFVEMGDVLSSVSRQIDVNQASASQLALLPGINIVMAKKVVEYRDTNGLFSSEEDFIKAANVKEHFIPKIKTMIIIGTPEAPKKSNDDEDQGRIVDF